MSYIDLLKENNFPVAEVNIGNNITIGGGGYFPFLNYGGKPSNRPLIAMEIFDKKYENMPEALKPALEENLTNDTIKWALWCKEKGADIIFLRMQSFNAADGKPIVEKIKQVESLASAVNLPLIIWGSGNAAKDNEFMPLIAFALKGRSVLMGPVNQNNINIMAPCAAENGHGLIIETPLDINIAKQIALSLNNAGVALNKLAIYPTSGAIGYGFEYAYSVCERIRLAGFAGDKYLALPIMSIVGEVVWAIREANENDPEWGGREKRAVMWEAMTALSYITAGSNIVVVRHPETMRLVKGKMDELFASRASLRATSDEQRATN